MPSEQRLHPAAVLFDLGRQLKNFALPGLLLLFTSSRGSQSPGPVPGVPGWSAWMLLLIVPAMIASVVRYLTFRLRYEDDELVIRQGVVFRSERHVPYSRIQNLDAVQGLPHRMLGVVEVRIETGGGAEAEASIRVLPMAAFDEMRRRVFAGRATNGVEPATDPSAAPVGDVVGPRALLRLTVGDLLRHGFIESRGIVLIGAIYGGLWELGLMDRAWSRVPFVGGAGRSAVSTAMHEAFVEGRVPFTLLTLAIGGLIGVLIVMRLASMAWAAIRLYDFTVYRAGDDLRTRFGFFTRVSATIPLHHVQTVTIRDGLLHRWMGRTSVRVETAGSDVKGEESSDRQWLAPVIRRRDLPRFLGEVLPVPDLDTLAWQPVHPRAFARAVKPPALLSLLISLLLLPPFGWWAFSLLPLTLGLAALAASKRVAWLGWWADEDVVARRRGWLWREVTIARVHKIQAVALKASPFDRRTAMATIEVDTAGASESQRIAVPYLDVDVARRLHARLAVQAADTEFRW